MKGDFCHVQPNILTDSFSIFLVLWYDHCPGFYNSNLEKVIWLPFIYLWLKRVTVHYSFNILITLNSPSHSSSSLLLPHWSHLHQSPSWLQPSLYLLYSVASSVSPKNKGMKMQIWSWIPFVKWLLMVTILCWAHDFKFSILYHPGCPKALQIKKKSFQINSFVPTSAFSLSNFG